MLEIMPTSHSNPSYRWPNSSKLCYVRHLQWCCCSRRSDPLRRPHHWRRRHRHPALTSQTRLIDLDRRRQCRQSCGYPVAVGISYCFLSYTRWWVGARPLLCWDCGLQSIPYPENVCKQIYYHNILLAYESSTILLWCEWGRTEMDGSYKSTEHITFASSSGRECVFRVNGRSRGSKRKWAEAAYWTIRAWLKELVCAKNWSSRKKYA